MIQQNGSLLRLPMRLAGLTVLVGLVAACNEAPPTGELPFEPVGDVKHTMALVLEPAADTIWDSAGVIMTAAGEEDLAPTTDEGWLEVQHSAAVVADTGNLLMMPGLARDQADWIEISAGLREAGKRALAAAEAQDADRLFEVGGEIYNVCLSCHQLYWAEGARIQ